MRLSQGKKMLLLLLVIGLLTVIVACGQAAPEKQAAKTGSASSETSQQTAAKETPKSDYPSKNIDFIIPGSPGGGFDTYVRALAPFLEKYLPNKVTVVPVNKAGGGAAGEALSYLYTRSKPDGYTIGLLNIPGMVVEQFAAGKEQYDLTDFTFIGRVAKDSYIAVTTTKSNFQSFDDLKNSKRKVLVGLSGGASTTAGLTAVVAYNTLGFDVDFIPHNGTTESITSLLRGDIDIAHAPPSSVRRLTKEEEVRGLIQFTPEREAAFPDTPSAVEVGYPELADLALHRIVAVPPGTPDDIVEVLRDALAKALKDPEFIAWGEKTNNPISPLDGEGATKVVVNSVEVYGKYKDLLQSLK